MKFIIFELRSRANFKNTGIILAVLFYTTEGAKSRHLLHVYY